MLVGQRGAVLIRLPLSYHLSLQPFAWLPATVAACVTHPLDVMRVYVNHPLVAFGPDDLSQAVANLRWRYLAGQCRQDYSTKSWCVITLVQHIPYPQGIQGLYPGLTASIFRQMTYSVTRFGAYDAMKNVMSNNGESQLYS